MNAAAHHSMIRGEHQPLYRFMRLIIPQLRGADSSYRYDVQFSKLDLVDSADQYFDYPATTSYTMSPVYRINKGEDPLKALTHSVYNKLCLAVSYYKNPPIHFPLIITYDFGSAILDTKIFNRWWVYTSNDTQQYPVRNPSIELYFSSDGVTYDLADSVTYNYFPDTNYTRAFVRPLFKNV